MDDRQPDESFTFEQGPHKLHIKAWYAPECPFRLTPGSTWVAQDAPPQQDVQPPMLTGEEEANVRRLLDSVFGD